MSDLTAVSLFDGIGGFPLAFSRAGVHTVAAVEIDRAARGVVAGHFPGIAHFEDVTEVTGDDLRATGFDPDRGVVTAGWPCQDLSLAGRGLGLGGARSGLIGEVVRILADLRSRWFVLENVPGLLSSVCACPGDGACGRGCERPHRVPGGSCGPGRCMAIHGGAMGAILGALAGLGYGLAYRVLDAQHFGVPQRRRRVVIVGHLGDRGASAAVLLEPEGDAGDSTSRGQAGAGTPPVSTLRAGSGGGCGPDDNSAQGGRLIAFSLTSHHGRNEPTQDTLITTHALTSEGADASEDGTGRGTPLVPMTDTDVRRLTPVECERLQGFPDDWTATSAGRRQADAPRYRQLGNSIAVPVFEWVAGRIVAYEKGEL